MTAARRAAQNDLMAIAQLVREHHEAKGRPRSLDEVLARPLEDPWGRLYVLDATKDGLGVRSLGPDGKAHTDDDLVKRVATP